MSRARAITAKASRPAPLPEPPPVPETPLTVEMLVRALEESRGYTTIPGGGSFGHDSISTVLDFERLLFSLKQEIACG